MELNQALKKVAVIGAAGKMGRGIASLLLQEMAILELEEGKKEGNAFCLRLIDVNDQALYSLRSDLKEHLTKYAEKNINALRRLFADKPDLVSNADVVNAFAESALDLVRYDTDYVRGKNSCLIFEAIVENVEIKAKVFSSIIENGFSEGYFLTNTSSIPISVLDQKANINHRIIGFHFYNPPVVQKLVEVIIPSSTDPDLQRLGFELAALLQKIVVRSADVAGFIGNGQFVREVLFACNKVHEFQREFSLIRSNLYGQPHYTRLADPSHGNLSIARFCRGGRVPKNL